MNAVIIEPDGDWTLRRHPWAAEGFDVTLLDEPSEVLRYLRGWEAVDWWYDDVFAEGGVLVDLRERALAWFGGSELVRTIPMRRRHRAAVSAVWSGWQVRWAWRRTADILEPIGLAADPSLSQAPGAAAWVGPDMPGPAWHLQVVSVRDEAGALRLHLAAYDRVRRLLAGGPAGLPAAGTQRRQLTLPDPMSWGDGAHVDQRRREVTWWTGQGLAVPGDPGAAWPGWQLRFDEDRFENQVAQCGCELIMPAPADGQVAGEMRAAVGRMRLPPGRQEFVEAALGS